MRSEFVVSSFRSVTFDFVPPGLTYSFLTLLLPECLMEFFWGDSTVWICGQNPMIWPHSNEISLPALTLGAIWFSKFEKMKLKHLVEICFWLNWQWKGYIIVCFSRLAVLYWIVCLFVCFFLSYLVIKKRKEVNYVQFWLW